MRVHHLLDTNILSDIVRKPDGKVAETILQRGIDTVCTSIIVAAEMRFGAMKSGSDQLQDRVEQLLSTINVLPYATPADEYYARLRNALEKTGELIGTNDMLIASQALALNLTVVTANVGEFSRVPDLIIDNWI